MARKKLDNEQEGEVVETPSLAEVATPVEVVKLPTVVKADKSTFKINGNVITRGKLSVAN